jgi:hypothetical protein
MARPLKILLCIAIPAALLLCLMPGIIFGALAKRDIADMQDAVKSDWEKYKTLIDSDEAKWKNHELIQVRQGEDASPLLFKYIRWDVKTNPPVPNEIVEALKANTSSFVDHVDDVNVSHIDLGFMGQLKQFAYFDIDATNTQKTFNVFTEKIPNFTDVQNIAKVRMLQGLVSGDARVAAAEVRELARLCLSTEQIVGEMVGVMLLGVEAPTSRPKRKIKTSPIGFRFRPLKESR